MKHYGKQMSLGLSLHMYVKSEMRIQQKQYVATQEREAKIDHQMS